MDVVQTYREVSPGLRREFTLYPERVVIIGRILGGRDFQTQIPLQGLAPDYGFIRFRSRRCAVGFMLFAAFSALLWLFLGPFQMPLLSARIAATGALWLASLGLALYYLPKYTTYRFLNQSGISVMDIIESGPDKDRCKEFVELVAESIRQARSKGV